MWACHESANRLTPSLRNAPRLVRVESRIWASSVNVPALRMAQKSWSRARFHSSAPFSSLYTTQLRSSTSRSAKVGAASFRERNAATDASMLHPVAIWGSSSTASTTTWFRRMADSDRKGEPWAAHDARNADRAVCTDLHSASVSTRLAVYIHTLAPSGRVKPSRHCCNAEEVRSAMGQRS